MKWLLAIALLVSANVAYADVSLGAVTSVLAH